VRIAINRRTVLTGLFFGGFVLACVWWLRSPPIKARFVRPLLAEMDAYKTTNGGYPTSCVSFASFSQLSRRFRVYTGGRDTNGVISETREVSSHDFAVLADSPGYEVFLPVGRMKMISFSSFPVWRYDSTERRWQKGRIHWSYSGSYWSKD